MKSRLLLCSLVAAAALFPGLVAAHSAGPSLEKRVGSYLIDMGYSMFDPVAGQEVLFDVVMIQNPDSFQWSVAPYKHVRVEIGANQEEKPFVYEVDLDRPIRAIFPYTFPHGGHYELSARFSGSGGVLAEASFPLEIRSTEDWWTPRRMAAAIGIVLLIGGVVGMAFVLFSPSRSRS